MDKSDGDGIAQHCTRRLRSYVARRSVLVLAAVVAGSVASSPARANGPLAVVDIDTGHLLYAERPHQRWHPASLTKIMTAYLTFRAVKEGRLSFDDKIVTSKAANAMPASKIGLPVGAEMSLDLAIKSVIIKSANDVSVMLAEAIDGSVAAFAARMNRTAQRLGMTRTNFVNPNGLPALRQVTTAADLAKLTRAVLSEFPEHAHYWATPTMRIGKIRLRSHNSLLRTFPGATGLKTGFICDSGFNVVASAKRDGRHLAAIVLGETTPQDRQARAAALLDHGFATYDWKVFLKAPKVDGLAAPQADPPAPSIRQSIKVWDCRRKPVRRTTPAKRKPATTSAQTTQRPAPRS
ncbi:MAG: D-alanyl-D-alanine carboxypeptidase family protein [Pseudomonadota bacterium]